MLEEIIKIICAILFSFINYYAMKKLLKSKENILMPKNIFFCILTAFIYYIFHTTDYDLEKIFLKLSLAFFADIFIFKESFFKTVVAYVIFNVTLIIADVINTSIYMQFITLEEMRSIPVFVISANTTTIFTMVLMMQIKPLKQKINNFIESINIKYDYDKAAFFVFLMIIIIVLFFNILNTYKLNYVYLVNMLVIITVLVISFIYINNSLNYNNLLKSYDELFKYIQNFEDIIDNISLSSHEMKNQLIVLKSYIELKKYKETLALINDIIKVPYHEDGNVLSNIKYIPKGGLKGLLYYKLLMAKAKKINIEIDSSITISKLLEKLSIDNNKILCQIIGIYLDNAIEEALNTSKKIMAVELYSIEKGIVNIVISNTYRGKYLNLEKIGKKGYTTKGKGHGKGTYLANKLISKNDWLASENKVLNKLYMQRITIDTTQLKK